MKRASLIAALIAVVLMLLLGSYVMRGATPKQEPPVPAPAAAPNAGFAVDDANTARLERTVKEGGFALGEPVDVSLSVVYTGKEPVHALAIEETLPEGWRFLKVVDGAVPAIVPEEGATGVLTFVWIQVPPMPVRFTYRALPNRAGAGASIVGKLVYRRTGAEEQSELTVTELVAP